LHIIKTRFLDFKCILNEFATEASRRADPQRQRRKGTEEATRLPGHKKGFKALYGKGEVGKVKDLHWLRVLLERIKYRLAVLVYRCRN